MRIALAELQCSRARSLDDALAQMGEKSPPMLIAGCTDVFVGLNFGTLREQRFLDITTLPLHDIGTDGDTLRIGALTTYTQMIASPIVRERLPMLVEAARQVGGVQIQNRGTIGGNIANGSPAGDTLPVLAAANAIIALQSAAGVRRVQFNDFYTGYRTTVRRPDELIVAVEIPRVEGKQWFRKVGTRAAQAISKLVIAGVRGPETRLAIGSVAATVMRARRTEAALAAGASLEAASDVLATEITPIDDIRSTADYRRRVAQNLLQRFWHDTA